MRAFGQMLALVVLCGACVQKSAGTAAIAVRGRVGGRDIDRVFGRFACEHHSFINVYDGRGNVLVFAPQGWKSVVGTVSMERPARQEDPLQNRSSAGWINADFSNGFSVYVLAGHTTVTEVTDTHVSGQLDWMMGLPADSGRLRAVGAFRAVRGCPP